LKILFVAVCQAAMLMNRREGSAIAPVLIPFTVLEPM
jgi:hypothetical protein